MNDRTRREMAARYVHGTMNDAERTALEQLLAGDERLRMMVQAERTVDVAFARGTRRTARALTAEHAATRAAVMAGLANPTPGPVGIPPVVGGSAGAGMSITAKIIIASIVGLGGLAGGYLALRETGDGPRTAPPRVEAPADHPAVAPGIAPPAANAEAGKPVEATQPDEHARPIEPAQPAENAKRPDAHALPERTPRAVMPANAAAPKEHAEKPTATAPTERAAPVPPPAQPRVVIKRTEPRVTADSNVRLKVTIPKGSVPRR